MPETTERETSDANKHEPLLSWMITRPVIDRFMMRDMAKVTAICLIIFIGILAFVVSTGKHPPSFLATLGIFGIMVGAIAFFLLVTLGVVKLMHRKGMVQVFMLTEDTARFLYGKDIDGGYDRLSLLVGAAGALTGNVHWAGLLLKERNNQNVPWGAILKYREYPERLVITLYHKIAPVMRLYCPTQEIYQQALEIVQQRSAAGKGAIE